MCHKWVIPFLFTPWLIFLFPDKLLGFFVLFVLFCFSSISSRKAESGLKAEWISPLQNTFKHKWSQEICMYSQGISFHTLAYIQFWNNFYICASEMFYDKVMNSHLLIFSSQALNGHKWVQSEHCNSSVSV